MKVFKYSDKTGERYETEAETNEEAIESLKAIIGQVDHERTIMYRLKQIEKVLK